MNEQTLQPLVDNKKISQVYVVHELDVPEMVKVKQYSPPKWLHPSGHGITPRGVLMAIAHLLLMVYITVVEKPDATVGFHIFHAQYAFICGKIFKKPVIVYIDDWPGNWHLRRRLIPMLKHCNVVATTGTKARAYLIKQGIDEG
ncbi:MAG: hypothetical protein MUO97_06035, partial [Dehalococcoidia bacterium]|nr:hypothetical protein [Dehalococcoidia bacterium]